MMMAHWFKARLVYESVPFPPTQSDENDDTHPHLAVNAPLIQKSAVHWHRINVEHEKWAIYARPHRRLPFSTHIYFRCEPIPTNGSPPLHNHQNNRSAFSNGLSQ